MTETADQFECTRRLLSISPDTYVVSNLGIATFVLADVDDRPRNFYLWGSMGVTTPIGFGMALRTDEPVTVLEGDGSLLMSLGALSTVGAYNPENLTIVVWDNAEYSTTGGQETHSKTTDFETVAQGCGLATAVVDSDDAFESAYRAATESNDAEIIICRVDPVKTSARPPLDFSFIKRRVRDEFLLEG